MVSKGMKRYRTRSDAQSQLIGNAQTEETLNLEELFGRAAPTRLEIGFGHGQFLSNLAASHPDENMLGVEAIDIRVTKTAHKSVKNNAANVRLFNDDAHHFLRHRVPAQSLNRTYILFPDPWPKPKQRRRRYVTRSFLLDLAHAMQPGGRFIFASDTHNYSLQVLNNLSTLPGLWRNCYSGSGFEFDIPTRFPTVFEKHKKAEGCTICYLMFERTDTPAGERVPWQAPTPQDSAQ